MRASVDLVISTGYVRALTEHNWRFNRRGGYCVAKSIGRFLFVRAKCELRGFCDFRSEPNRPSIFR